MPNKKQDSEFIVSDRRKFTSEGEPRPDAPVIVEEREQRPSTPEEKASPQQPEAAAAAEKPQSSVPPAEAEVPLPPSADEQRAQKDAYDESNRKLNEQLKEKLGATRSVKDFEMTFERLVASLYMTALMQLGMVAPEGEQPRADIMGARQTIDTIALLQEKTKGNLTEAEKNLLQHSLYELRMAWLEITNAITRGPAPGTPGTVAGGSGGGPLIK